MVNNVVISGLIVRDPELRFTPSGNAVASFTVAYNDRRFDKATNTWSNDGDTLFLPVEAWKQLAEGAAESLTKGTPVIVSGKLKQQDWEKDGNKKSRVFVVAEEISTSVRAKRGAAPVQEAAPW